MLNGVAIAVLVSGTATVCAGPVAVVVDRFRKKLAGTVALIGSLAPVGIPVVEFGWVRPSGFWPVLALYGSAPVFLAAFFLYGLGERTPKRGLAAGASLVGAVCAFWFTVALLAGYLGGRVKLTRLHGLRSKWKNRPPIRWFSQSDQALAVACHPSEGTQSSPMTLAVETELEEDGRWLAAIQQLPGVMAYGTSREEAIARTEALALRVLADNLAHCERKAELEEVFTFAV